MIKDLVVEIEETLSSVQLDAELKSNLIGKIAQLKSQSQLLMSDHKRTTDQSVMRKGKLGQLSNTVLQLQNQLRQMDILKNEVEKLQGYKDKDLQNKTKQVQSYKNFLHGKLANKSTKQYQKYNSVSKQFNFEDTSEQNLNRTLDQWRLLQSVGTFGQTTGKVLSSLDRPKATTQQAQGTGIFGKLKTNLKQ